MNDDDKANRDDALLHSRWLEQNDTDPHRVHIDHLNNADVQRYLGWHRARLRTLTQTFADLARTARQNGRNLEPLPILEAQKQHHEQMIDRLKTLLPAATLAGGYQKPKPLTKTTATGPDAAAVVRYARLHGITVRQAAHLLAQQGATR